MSARPRADGERAPLRRNFRDWIFRYICNAVHGRWSRVVSQLATARQGADRWIPIGFIFLGTSRLSVCLTPTAIRQATSRSPLMLPVI
jgi:hypothetical protein